MFKHRLTRTVAVVVAIGAVAAPAAAALPIDEHGGATLQRDFQTADTRDAAVPRGLYEPMRPEDQPQPPQDLRNPDTVDYANGRGTHNSPEVVVVDLPKPVNASNTPGGIDWADVGLGAGSLLGLGLIALAGCALIVQRRGSKQLA